MAAKPLPYLWWTIVFELFPRDITAVAAQKIWTVKPLMSLTSLNMVTTPQHKSLVQRLKTKLRRHSSRRSLRSQEVVLSSRVNRTSILLVALENVLI
ncbi:hypothetical protein J6590_089173 [Homalodisca vitripennis]|nr:hypothetical protein J6590_089173 [Homalodisca vitripennis]